MPKVEMVHAPRLEQAMWMKPHEKDLAKHKKAVEKVNRGVRLKKGTVYLWLKPGSALCSTSIRKLSIFGFSFFGVGFLCWLSEVVAAPVGQEKVVTVFLWFHGLMMLAYVIGGVVFAHLDERMALSACEEEVEELVEAIKPYPVLVEKLESWVRASEASILTKSQCEFLTAAGKKLNELEARERERLACLTNV